MKSSVGFYVEAGFHFRLQMETKFQLYVEPSSQMVHELEKGVGIYVDAGFCLRITHLEYFLEACFQTTQFWKPASPKYCRILAFYVLHHKYIEGIGKEIKK